MRNSLCSLLLSCIPFVAPSTPCAADTTQQDVLRSFSFSVAGMTRPQSIHILQKQDGTVLLQSDDHNGVYRREVDATLLQTFTDLAQRHNILAWADFKDRKLPAGMELLDGATFQLQASWTSGKGLDIFGHVSRPTGYAAFASELMDIWQEAVRRFPPATPRTILSDKIKSFSFTEQREQDENSWLLLYAHDFGSYISVRICRGRQATADRTYYKAPPSFFNKLHMLTSRYKLLSWQDKGLAAQREYGNPAVIVPYAQFSVRYHPVETEDALPDYEEYMDIIFSPERQPDFAKLRQELFALFEEVEQGERYSY